VSTYKNDENLRKAVVGVCVCVRVGVRVRVRVCVCAGDVIAWWVQQLGHGLARREIAALFPEQARSSCSLNAFIPVVTAHSNS